MPWSPESGRSAMTSGTKYASPPCQRRKPKKSVAVPVKLPSAAVHERLLLPTFV